MSQADGLAYCLLTDLKIGGNGSGTAPADTVMMCAKPGHDVLTSMVQVATARLNAYVRYQSVTVLTN